ncbi:DUF2169 domain-containing protein [Kalamiella sp. sgz302252]|uniref:DUF2169 family type VI secretion system accessory protein n=1 Tax=Pantoea sp. sgz302252 TaxID=3341827 RepID=UPI0036D32464
MKIIKPLRLSVLNRPFRLEGKNHLGVAVLALTDMSATPQLRPEMELWQLAADELQTCGGVVDIAIPKVKAEFLATGFACTHHQQEKTACAVRIEIEKLTKTLIVTGDRFWSGASPTRPLPFEQMRLDWSRAFGGEGYEENPHGIGAVEEEQDGIKYRRLPNIEAMHARITAPRQQPEPASFSALDMQWPRRFKRMGKKYDDRWLKQDFPGVARDTDWRVFNAASADQWWQDRDSLPPEAEWRIWNMHPQIPVQQGKLPPWQARCFINRQRGEETLFEEIPLRATTVWFFPHLEKMLLIWHGNRRINEDDAADILQLMPALEKTGGSRSLSHYRKVLNQRLDKEKGALFAFREKDLIPQETIGPWFDSEVQQHHSPMRENLKTRVSQLREQHRTRLEGKGGDVSELLEEFKEPALPKLEDLPEFIEGMELKAAGMKAQAEKRRLEMEARFPAAKNQHGQSRGPESMHRMQAMLHKHADKMSEKKLAQSRDALHSLYLMSVQSQPPALRIKGDIALILRQRAERTLAQGGDFSAMDLTGVDFSGMDLSGGNFSKALLECADLSGCKLDGANFTEAILARADLRNASLRGCDFTKASLALAQCGRTNFSGSRLKETQMESALFTECDFSQAIMETLLLRNTGFSQCCFLQARLDSCLFMELTLPQPNFSQATLHKTTFIKCELQAAIFSEAQLDGCSLIESKADNACFNSAVLKTCAVVAESSLAGADFSGATLSESNLRQTLLTDASFELAKLENSDLSEARCDNASFIHACLAGSLFIRTDFRGADFTDANLMEALLQKAALGGACFSGTNLFRTDLSQSLVDEKTQLAGAFTKRTKVLPKRDGEVV